MGDTNHDAGEDTGEPTDTAPGDASDTEDTGVGDTTLNDTSEDVRDTAVDSTDTTQTDACDSCGDADVEADTGPTVSCSDGIQNGDETGVDCGGSTCDGCDDTLACSVDADCASTVCEANVCVPAFVTVWQTDKAQPPQSTSNEDQIKLPLGGGSQHYDFEVDWGDGTSDVITSAFQAEATHTYAAPGTYVVKITGKIDQWVFRGLGDQEKLLEVRRWGPLRLGSGGGYFVNAFNMEITATDTLDTSRVANMRSAFAGCQSITQIPGVNDWDMSSVVTMSNMFAGAWSFNQDLDRWDTSSVIDMSRMFSGTAAFHGKIDTWDTSSVEDMSRMFEETGAFNRDIGRWNTSSVDDMTGMFARAQSFNRDIGGWDMSGVGSTKDMFRETTSFNADIGGWDVGNVRNLSRMFADAVAFNQDIGAWDVSGASNMFATFSGATSFDQDLGGWDISDMWFMDNMFDNSGLSTPNYDAILIGWASQTVQPDVSIDFGHVQYSAGAASDARDTLTGAPNNWTIRDGGQKP